MSAAIPQMRKENEKLKKQQTAMMLKILDKDQENEALRRAVAAIDARLDMQLMFFHKVMESAGTLPEAKKWWLAFIGEIGEAEQNANGEISLDVVKDIRDKHGLHWHDEYTEAVRVQKTLEWVGHL
jgi:hypothetical protein